VISLSMDSEEVTSAQARKSTVFIEMFHQGIYLPNLLFENGNMIEMDGIENDQPIFF
jgi:hypothetical protein